MDPGGLGQLVWRFFAPRMVSAFSRIPALTSDPTIHHGQLFLTQTHRLFFLV
jgi:hypothetical protein